MKHKSKILALLISLIICLSMFTITAYADNDDLNGDGNSGSSQVDPDYGDQPVDPSPDLGDPDDNPPDYGDDGSGDDGGDNLDDGNSGGDYSDGNTGGYDGNDDGNNDGYGDYNNGYDNSNDGNNDGNAGYVVDNNNSYDDNYYDNNWNSNDDNYYDYSYDYTPNYQEPDLYNTDGKINIDVLSDNDWNLIAQSLQNAEANEDDGIDDFNFIKKNNSSSDNGLWMLISGAIFIILAIAGIAYVIISYMNKKKNFAYAGAGGSSTFAKKSGKALAYRAKNDYDDGFSSTKSKAKKTIGKKRIDDTAEIVLPKNKNKNRYRYK